MGHLSDEVASQPDLWLRGVETASEQSALLPPTGARVAFIGCGTSWHVAESVAAYREAQGLGESDGFNASEMPRGRRYDVVVAISRSGQTTEVLDALREQPDGTRKLAITAVEGGPIGEVVDGRVELPWADEQAVGQTRFATTVLAMLLGSYGWDVAGSAKHAREVLGMGPMTKLFDATKFVFCGRGPALGMAREAALKMSETLGICAEAYPTREIRHGPIAGLNRKSVVWVLDAAERSINMLVQEPAAQLVRGSGDPLSELVRIQHTIVQMAEQRGVNPDAPPYRFRSVELLIEY